MTDTEKVLAFIDERISWHKDTHTETYAEYITRCTCQEKKYPVALRAVVELHKPFQDSSGWWHCNECDHIGDFGCPTIQAIEKELG